MLAALPEVFAILPDCWGHPDCCLNISRNVEITYLGNSLGPNFCLKGPNNDRKKSLKFNISA